MTLRNINKPIFILGSGRSGTTLLYDLLAIHPDICWFSELTDGFPHLPHSALMQRALRIPLFGDLMQRKIINESSPMILKPSEGSNIYDGYSGFVKDKRSTEKDWSGKVEKKFKLIIRKHLMATEKSRFINKQPANTQRIRLIHELFSDAYFVHIIRDGRAVVNSLLHTDWWPNIQLWWLNGKKPSEVLRYRNNQVKLGALHWKHNVIEIRRNRKLLGNRYIEVRYEGLISDPRGTIKKILQFCELPNIDEYLRRIPIKFPNMNEKWKKELTDKQQRVLYETLNPFLRELGYLGEK